MHSTLHNIIETAFEIGVIINSLLFIPQILHLFRQKNSHGISLATFGGFTLLNGLTICHAVIRNDEILLLGSILSLTSCTIVSILIIFYRTKN
ncbi:MAG: hypothetical protein I8H75_04940 [Myxococcaceae bacterium]|nr:hypothetical protein [Myxococcaceae bacterium]MBH2006671.1 hypothetical protein [Myxococcaceae bacterium]